MTTSLSKLSRTCQYVSHDTLVWPKWLTGVLGYRSLHPWGQPVLARSLAHRGQHPQFTPACHTDAVLPWVCCDCRPLSFRSESSYRFSHLCIPAQMSPKLSSTPQGHPFSFLPIAIAAHVHLYDGHVRVLSLFLLKILIPGGWGLVSLIISSSYQAEPFALHIYYIRVSHSGV